MLLLLPKGVQNADLPRVAWHVFSRGVRAAVPSTESASAPAHEQGSLFGQRQGQMAVEAVAYNAAIPAAAEWPALLGRTG
eukprot:1371062-Pleurochrysis_carterae.AAC.1